MILNGSSGARYGIPFPILARSSFGILGSNIPAMLRGMVACGWFGIHTWIGGQALYSAISHLWPGISDWPNILPSFMAVKTGPFTCFMIFWAITLWILIKGMKSIKLLEAISAPVLLIASLMLLYWALSQVGISTLLNQPQNLKPGTSLFSTMTIGISAMVGFWATLSLNIPDFTRYAKDQKAQLLGQSLGLPITMLLFALVGALVTKASYIKFGKAIWDPIELISYFDNKLVSVIACIVVCLATLSTNIAANLVGPANDISNINPKRISFKTGGVITAIVGILIMPWKLVADPSGYIFTWLIGYSTLLGPILGILLTDYYLINKQVLNVEQLYHEDGQYGSVNLIAVVAFLMGVLPNILGFLFQVGAITYIPTLFINIYQFAWFVGVFVSSISYLSLHYLIKMPSRQKLKV